MVVVLNVHCPGVVVMLLMMPSGGQYVHKSALREHQTAKLSLFTLYSLLVSALEPPIPHSSAL